MKVTLSALAAFLVGCGGGLQSPSSLQPPLVSGNGRTAHASASEQVLYSFTGGNDGGDPAADLNFDANGNVDGTTVAGGHDDCGTVFQLKPRSSPPWHESVLYNFTCYGDGKNPNGGVTFDAQGNLYGTTVSGGNGGSCGSTGCGVAWQLHTSGESVLHSFTGGDDGFGPGGGLSFDHKGRLYGTTPDGGTYNSGVVYELFRGTNGNWRERVVHAFNGGSEGGMGSLGRLLLGRGTFYGVTETGGAHSAGTAYVLVRHGGGRGGGYWQLITLYAFKGSPDCGSPYGGLIAGRNGNLYGTTYYGGANGHGCVFELIAGRQHYAEHVVYNFIGGNGGSNPTSTLLFSRGLLYGTTSMGGGSCDCGTVFKLDAKTGAETILHAFSGGSDGAYPYYGLLQDPSGHLLGTTAAGGTSNQGTVFEVTP